HRGRELRLAGSEGRSGGHRERGGQADQVDGGEVGFSRDRKTVGGARQAVPAGEVHAELVGAAVQGQIRAPQIVGLRLPRQRRGQNLPRGPVQRVQRAGRGVGGRHGKAEKRRG